MLKDMMPHFDLYQPDSVEAALDLAKRMPHGWLAAGGQDTYDWLKNRTKRATAVIDITGIQALKGIRETDAGLEIGALATLSEIESDPVVRQKYSLLSTAAGRVASPQIRNVGTLGGNLCQDTRCWYYRGGVDCYRAGGNVCYADTPQGQNREHAIFGASRCVAVSPSDTAVAAVALDASMVIRSQSGERVVPADEFFIGPAIDIRRMTVIEPGEILTAVRFPNAWAGAKFYFEKVADRQTWDFSVMSIAAAMVMEGDTIRNARLVCGAVECVPRRLVDIEKTIIGNARSEELVSRAASMAAEGAKPLNFNHFKMPLMENLVRRAIRDA